MSPWVNTAGTILGTAITSGAFVSWLNSHFTNRRAELDFRRKKLEELYIAIDWYCSTLIGYYGSKDEDYVSSDVMDLIKKPETVKEVMNTTHKIQMMIALYFPVAESRWLDTKGMLDRIAELQMELTINPDAKDIKGNSLNTEFVNMLLFFNKKRIDFLDFLSNHGKELKISL